jgi:tRNA A-37 threonylcarbamoyl transferase component Bud32
VGVGKFFGKTVILKERVKKEYRHPELDARLTSKRALQVSIHI